MQAIGEPDEVQSLVQQNAILKMEYLSLSFVYIDTCILTMLLGRPNVDLISHQQTSTMSSE